jgi:hypothetical protein
MAKTSTFQTNEDGDYVAGDLKGYCEGYAFGSIKILSSRPLKNSNIQERHRRSPSPAPRD